MEKYKRIFIDEVSKNIILSGDNYNYLVNATRHKVGNKIIVCKKGQPFDYVYKIESIQKNSLNIIFEEQITNDSETKVDVTVFQAVAKFEKMELITQKLNELGVKNLVPVMTKNVVVKKETTRLDRLPKIAVESSKQCGRADFINIGNLTDLDKVDFSKFDLAIIAFENEREKTLSDILAQNTLQNYHKIAIIIGSEGGFEQSEIALLEQKGVRPVSLGSRIMRTETAAIALTAAVMFSFGEWD